MLNWHLATQHDFSNINICLILSQDVEPAAFSGAVSHFLNCLLNSSSCFPDSCSDELLSRRRSRRRRSQGGRAASLKDGAWTKMTPSELWSRIRNEAREYYHLTIERCVCVCVCVRVWGYVQQDLTLSSSLCSVKVWTRQ